MCWFSPFNVKLLKYPIKTGNALGLSAHSFETRKFTHHNKVLVEQSIINSLDWSEDRLTKLLPEWYYYGINFKPLRLMLKVTLS